MLWSLILGDEHNLTTMNKKEAVQKEAVDTLKQWGLVDGTTVYAKVNKVSASGMSRNVALYITPNDWKEGKDTNSHRIMDISYHSAKALGWSFKEGYNGGIRVSGCGMDMLFHTVYSLSYAMGYGAMNQSNDPANKSTGLKYRQL